MSGKSSDAQVIANYAALETTTASLQGARAQALFIWDYLATFDSEVQYVWGQRLSAATILFIVNRYVNLLITILELIEQAPFQTPEVSAITTCVPMSTGVQTVDGSSCPPVVRVLQSLLISATFIVAVFASLRVYAIWSRDWRPALLIFVLALVTPIANLYMDITGTPIPAPRPSVGLAVVIAERVTTTAYDGLVLLFTLMKTARVRRAAMSLDTSPSLMALILRDGTLYFLLLVLMNIAQIVVAAKIPGNNFIAFFISPLTSILISRFLLNLRQVARSSDSDCDDTTETVVMSTGFPSIHLSTGVLGNMGAPLYSGFEAETTEEMGGEKISGADGPLVMGLSPGVRHVDIELRDVA
ncbi:hypothetical protein ONZ51_g7565 [Trametes cubensis]|uniref:DUF6533 domain-containing protein n=1 Tax=Trametes cubensis TaxID=1111947 RepID=A0AAD7XBL6_9APHY|nr:hypothetical protein ONZ51_g7565 [Trametes cubensis]